jgi:hypothetical protein
MHHIFFPPGLEAVCAEACVNRAEGDGPDHALADERLSEQFQGPPLPAFRRVSASQGNQVGFLASIEDGGRAGPRSIIERTLETAFRIPLAYPLHGTNAPLHFFRNDPIGLPPVTLQEYLSPLDDSCILGAFPRDSVYLLPLLGREMNDMLLHTPPDYHPSL